MTETLGEILRATRAKRGLSMEQVAAEVGVRYSAYRLWEKDAGRPNAEHLGRLALWLGMPLSSLLRRLGAIDADEEARLLELAKEAARQTRSQR